MGEKWIVIIAGANITHKKPQMQIQGRERSTLNGCFVAEKRNANVCGAKYFF